MSKIDRVAQAILTAAMPHANAWDMITEDDRNRCREQARAAIEAMDGPQSRAEIVAAVVKLLIASALMVGAWLVPENFPLSLGMAYAAGALASSVWR